MFSGGVGQVESTSPVVGPTHELDSDLVASWLDEPVELQAQTAVLLWYTAGAAAGNAQQRGSGQLWELLLFNISNSKHAPHCTVSADVADSMSLPHIKDTVDVIQPNIIVPIDLEILSS